MRITKLQTQNFRCFQALDLHFHGNVTLLLGTNGAGKTTVLDMLHLALKVMSKDAAAFCLTSDDICKTHNDSYFSESIVEIDIEEDSYDLFRKITIQNSPLLSQRVKINHSELLTPDAMQQYLRRNVKEEKMVFHSFPIFWYYDINRNFYVDHTLDEKNRKYAELNSFSDFVKWFDEETALENEHRLEKDLNYRNPNLQLIRVAVESFLDALHHSTYKALRIKKERTDYQFVVEGNRVRSHLMISKNGQELKLSQVSAGEKNILRLVIDIARRLIDANKFAQAPLEGKGIVLIDEIELHLHSSWQSEVVPALTHIFPNIQFILTTHSQEVVRSVAKENIILLQDSVATPISSLSKEMILETILGVKKRPIAFSQQLSQFYSSIEANDFAAAESILELLTYEYGTLDTDLLQAHLYLDEISVEEKVVVVRKRR